MKLWKLSAREVRYRPGRAALTLLSVIIGVGAVIAVDVAMSTTRSGYKKMFEALTGRAALEVVARGRRGFEEGLLEELEKQPGVVAVAPLIQRPTIFRHNDKGYKVIALGIDPQRDKFVHDFELASGKPFGEKDSALLEVSFAENLEIRPDEKFRLLTPSGLRTRTLTGLLRCAVLQVSVAAARCSCRSNNAQQLFRMRGRIDTALLVLREEVDVKKFAADLQQKLPEGVEVREPATRTKMAEETLLIRRARLEDGRRTLAGARHVHHSQHVLDECQRTPPAILHSAGHRSYAQSGYAAAAYGGTAAGRSSAPQSESWSASAARMC